MSGKAKISGTNGMSADGRAYPTFTSPHYAPLPGESLGPLPPVLKQEDADMVVARGYEAHFGRQASLRNGNGNGAYPSAPPGDMRSGEPLGRPRAGSVPRPRLVIPQDPPPPSHPSGDNGRRRRTVANPDVMAGSRPQELPRLNGHPDHEPDRHAYFHGSRMSPVRETPLPSYPMRPPPIPAPQRGLAPHQFVPPDSPEDGPLHARKGHYSFQTTLTSPTIVSPPTPSTVFEEMPPSGFLVGIKGSRLHDSIGSHLKSDAKKPDVEPVPVRDAGTEEKGRGADPEGVSGGVGKPREDGRDTMYSDLFEGRGATSLELESITSRREGTPFSDRSEILVPRGTASDVLSSMAMARKAQSRPAHPPSALPTRPTSRPRSRSEEESLHCDELNVPPHKSLSKMEKAILRRIEFGQNIDFLRVQLS